MIYPDQTMVHSVAMINIIRIRLRVRRAILIIIIILNEWIITLDIITRYRQAIIRNVDHDIWMTTMTHGMRVGIEKINYQRIGKISILFPIERMLNKVWFLVNQCQNEMIHRLIEEIHLNNSMLPVHIIIMMNNHIWILMAIDEETIGMIHGIGTWFRFMYKLAKCAIFLC